jgi:hypothetical protein
LVLLVELPPPVFPVVVVVVFVAVAVVVDAFGLAGIFELLIGEVAFALFEVRLLTEEASLFGRAFDAVALDTGPRLVATIKGAYADAPCSWSVVKMAMRLESGPTPLI